MAERKRRKNGKNAYLHQNQLRKGIPIDIRIVSDAVLDALLEQDPFSRVACETCTNTGFVLVMGEVTSKAVIDIPAIVRKTVTEIGYDSSEKGFDGNTCAVMVSLDKQSRISPWAWTGPLRSEKAR